MTDLKDFHAKNKEFIHALLNHMWQTIEQIAFQFESDFPEIDIENAHGNFIELQNGWAESYYANPIITFPFGELGYSLDGLYCTLSVASKKVNETHLLRLMELIQGNDKITLEIYGGDDCFTTFYNPKEEADLDEILQRIKDSKEDILQIDFGTSFQPEDETKEFFLEALLQAINFLRHQDLLVILPIANNSYKNNIK